MTFQLSEAKVNFAHDTEKKEQQQKLEARRSAWPKNREKKKMYLVQMMGRWSHFEHQGALTNRACPSSP